MDKLTESWIRDVMERVTGAPAFGLPVVRLAGHASVRSYWRVGGAGRHSVVVMAMPPDAPSDEISKEGHPRGAEPFVSVQRYLAGIGIRVQDDIHVRYRDHGRHTAIISPPPGR